MATDANEIPLRQIRAVYDFSTIRVYQAFCPAIADAALAAQRFVEPFSLKRMSWIKPSFLWMMYRSGWASKPGQERVLAVTIPRAAFDHLLHIAALSSFDAEIHVSKEAWKRQLAQTEVRVQWDPERDLQLRSLHHRTIQLGLAGGSLADYAGTWILRIDDVTPLARIIAGLVNSARFDEAARSLPTETPYVVSAPSLGL